MINPPLNFTGSKYKLLEQLLPHFDYSKPKFIDLFTGGGSVYSNVLDKYDKIIINDIIGDLIDIHRLLMLNPSVIIEKTKKLATCKEDKEKFLELRDSYNEDKTPDKLWALMLSCTSNLMRFNKKFKFNQTWGKRGWNDSTQKKTYEYVNHIRKYREKMEYRSGSFKDIKINSSNCMVYIDPPYGFVDNDGDIGNTQISEAGYNCYYNKQDDIDLLQYVLDIDNNGSSFVISGLLEHNEKESWLLKKLIKEGFKHELFNYNYNKVSRNGNKVSKEIIIKNF